VEIEVVRRLLGRFQDGQVFLVEMFVLPVPCVQGEEKGVVGIVRIRNVYPAQVEMIIPWHNGKVGIQ
jgi:hypothetical protein